MATVNFCGFETGDETECFSPAGTRSVQSSVVRSGGYALRVNPTTTAVGSVQLAKPGTAGTGDGNANLANSWTRFYFRYATKPASGAEEIFGTAACRFSIRLKSDGVLAVYNSSSNTLLATGTIVLAANTWYRIEQMNGQGTTAAFEVKIDGIVDISTTGDIGTFDTDQVVFGKKVNRSDQTVDFFFDDIMWSDSGYPGISQCAILLPNANGNYQNWTIGAGGGSNFQNVDEVPHDGDTTYLLAPAATTAETEALQSGASASITGTVNCVKAVATLKRNGASNGSVALRLRSGSTDSDAASNYTTTSAYVLISKIFDTDPATSSAWVLGALDSIETGSVNKDATNLSRMTLTAAMVDFTPSVSPFPLPWRTKQRYDPPIEDFSAAWQQMRRQPIPIGAVAIIDSPLPRQASQRWDALPDWEAIWFEQQRRFLPPIISSSDKPPTRALSQQLLERRDPTEVLMEHFIWWNPRRLWPVPTTTPLGPPSQFQFVPRDPKLEMPLRKFVDIVAGIVNDLQRRGILVKIGQSDWTIAKTGGISSTRAPVVMDDETEGYSIGQVWVDTGFNRVYVAVDVTDSAAIWVLIGGGLTGTLP